MTGGGSSPPALGFAVAIAAASLFAWLGPLSRWAYEGGMEPLPFVAWRAGVGAGLLGLLVVAGVRRGRALVRPAQLRRREATSLGLAVLLALALNLSIFAAFQRVTIAIALIGFYTYPAMVAATAILLGREAPSRAVLAALGLAIVGMALVVAGSLDPAAAVAADAIGILLALTAAATQTAFVTLSRDYVRVPAEQAMGLILGGTLLGCLAIAAATGGVDGLAEPLRRPDLLPIVVAAGAAGAALPSLLFLLAIRLIGGTRAGILMLLEPVVAVVLAAVLLGETLRPVQVAGAAAVLAAAVLLQRSHRPVPEEIPLVAAHEAVPDPPATR